MSMSLTNARLTGGTTHIQKITPARTSIAEDAIFIPKPHKRVEFKISESGKGQTTGASLPGSGEATGSPETGGNLKMGSLGKDGITATLTKADYSARDNHVEVEYDYNPEKDFDVIAPQEEGRQTNNAQTTHYSQQYDAYGRPRIGFSREPYDFAATKFIFTTSEIRLKENVESSHAAFAYADMRNQADNPTENVKVDLSPMAKKMPDSSAPNSQVAKDGISESNKSTVQPQYEKVTSSDTPVPLPGSKEPSKVEEMKPLNYDKLPGAKKPGETVKEEAPKIINSDPTKISTQDVAEVSNVNFKEVLSPANSGSAPEQKSGTPEDLTSKHISITA